MRRDGIAGDAGDMATAGRGGLARRPEVSGAVRKEPLPRELADGLLERVAELWNLYGPTETTVWSTLERIEGGPCPITIGRPIANTQI